MSWKSDNNFEINILFWFPWFRRTSDLCSAAWARLSWRTLAFQTHIRRSVVCFPLNLGLWLLHLLHGGPSVWIYIKIFLIRAAALSNGQFKVLCVCRGPYAGWQMFISQLAFHLSMENNGLALCPALSWANKASYLTSNQAIIHLALNTWYLAEVQGSSCQEPGKLLWADTVLPSKIAFCLFECVSV